MTKNKEYLEQILRNQEVLLELHQAEEDINDIRSDSEARAWFVGLMIQTLTLGIQVALLIYVVCASR